MQAAKEVIYTALGIEDKASLREDSSGSHYKETEIFVDLLAPEPICALQCGGPLMLRPTLNQQATVIRHKLLKCCFQLYQRATDADVENKSIPEVRGEVLGRATERFFDVTNLACHLKLSLFPKRT